MQSVTLNTFIGLSMTLRPVIGYIVIKTENTFFALRQQDSYLEFIFIPKPNSFMNPITVDSSGERFLISVDKSFMDKAFLVDFVERIRIEYLAQKINFDEELQELGEEIKQSWWTENKSRFINPSDLNNEDSNS